MKPSMQLLSKAAVCGRRGLVCRKRICRREVDLTQQGLLPLATVPGLTGSDKSSRPADSPVSDAPSWKEPKDGTLAWELSVGRECVFLYPRELRWLLIPQFMTSRCLWEGDTHVSLTHLSQVSRVLLLSQCSKEKYLILS